MSISAVAAMLSKESAYCLPLLACAMLVYLKWPNGSGKIVFALSCVSVAIFSYRYWVLGGIGGYGAASGSPTILRFSALRTANALFFRQWALLFFPINWSRQPDLLLWIAFLAMFGMLVLVLVWRTGNRSRLLAALAMILAAALPVEHLLLIGADLNGVRVLYLPVLGLTLFWGLVIQAQKSFVRQIVIACGLLFFQCAALWHNLAIWRDVALLAQRSCHFIAAQIHDPKIPIAVYNLPAKTEGVYFLSNSFAVCVMFNSDGRLTTLPDIQTATGETPNFNRIPGFVWNEANQGFNRSR